MALSDTVTDALPYVDEAVTSPNDTGSDVTTCTSNRTPPSDLYYDMTGDKILIIFNHYMYKKTRHYNIVPSTRTGTWHDVKTLESTFRGLGFTVISHHDWKYKDIITYITNVCNKDHSGTSCLAVAVMTHGYGSRVCASDRLYPLDELMEIISTAPTLVGKPKLFFIQACRAGHTKPFRKKCENETDIHIDADFLVLYSSYEDYVSYRGHGTWMIQALCNTINLNRHLDMVTMATLVQRIVASKTTQNFGHKQMPTTQFNLLKFLKL